MPGDNADLTVRIAADPAQADQVVTVVADQVLTATPADVGKVVAVAADGSYELVAPSAGVADHGALTGLADDDHPYVLETLIDAAGDLLVGAAADTAGRLAMGSTVLKVPRRNAAGTGLEWSTLPGTLIGQTEYDPAGDTAIATTSLTLVDVAAADLAVSFVVPESGAVIVRLTAAGSVGTAGHRLQWGLRAGAADVADSAMMVTSISTGVLGCSRAKRFTGLVAGTALTWKWAHCNSSAVATVTTYCGNLFGPALMEVYAA